MKHRELAVAAPEGILSYFGVEYNPAFAVGRCPQLGVQTNNVGGDADRNCLTSKRHGKSRWRYGSSHGRAAKPFKRPTTVALAALALSCSSKTAALKRDSTGVAALAFLWSSKTELQTAMQSLQIQTRLEPSDGFEISVSTWS